MVRILPFVGKIPIPPKNFATLCVLLVKNALISMISL